jgi:hypothetical protein
MPNGISVSNYSENLILKFMLTTQSATRPTSWYVGFFSDSQGASVDQPSIELTGPGYSRQSVSFTTPTTGSCSNSNLITFTATGTWTPANYVGIFDSISSGNLLFWGELQTSIGLDADGEIQFAINTITISMD